MDREGGRSAEGLSFLFGPVTQKPRHSWHSGISPSSGGLVDLRTGSAVQRHCVTLAVSNLCRRCRLSLAHIVRLASVSTVFWQNKI